MRCLLAGVNTSLPCSFNRETFQGKANQISNPQVLESMMNRNGVALKQGVTSDNLFSDIMQKPTGQRPNPTTYLDSNYIKKELSQYDNAATRFTTESNYNDYGLGHRDNTSFVMPKSQADALIKPTNGDPIKLADALGIPRNQLNGASLLKIDVANPKTSGLRIPSGNEAGANSQWIPGVRLPSGKSEAVIDVTKINQSQLTITKIGN